MKKNIIAFLIVMALIVCMVPVASAANDPALTVTPNVETVAPGGTVTFTVALTNNTSNVCGVVTLTASEGLTLTSVTPIVSTVEDDFVINLEDGVIAYGIIADQTAATVTLFSATYTVAATAADGNYTVTASGAEFYEAYTAGSGAGTSYEVASGSATVAVATPSGVAVDRPGYQNINYTVDGQVVTVTNDNKPCKVGYWDAAQNKYVAIAAVASGNSYTFTAPAGVTEVILVIKGDIDGTGLVNAADKLTLARSLLPTSHNAYAALTAEQEFAANIDGVGTANAADKLTMARSLLPTSHNAYAALVW